MDQHQHGSPEVWNELFANRDLSYSEKADTQGKLFEMVKVKFLEKVIGFRTYNLKPVTSLEVGCGSAFVSLYFSKRGFEATCLDTSQEILKVAEKNFKQQGQAGKFVLGSAEKLPFKDHSFDIVMSFGLLEHFTCPDKAIFEMVRVLKEGGIFFADIVPARLSVQSLGNLFNGLAALSYFFLTLRWNLALKKFIRSFKPEYYENNLSWQAYRKMIIDCGLKNVQVRGNRPWPRLTLPRLVDQLLYTPLLKLSLPFWSLFDNYGGALARFWGAGYWFWAKK